MVGLAAFLAASAVVLGVYGAALALAAAAGRRHLQRRLRLGRTGGRPVLAGAAARVAATLLAAVGRRRLTGELARQLPEAAAQLAAVLRAGQTAVQGIAHLGRELPAPAGPLFARAHRELQLGRPLPVVLDELVARAGSRELHLLAVVLLLQRDVGGDLAGALDGMGRALAERQVAQQEVRTLTAEARGVAGLAPLLPAVALLVVHILIPGALDVFGTGPGLLLAGGFAALVAAVWYLIHRLSHMEV